MDKKNIYELYELKVTEGMITEESFNACKIKELNT
jgi:hypothetical protein